MLRLALALTLASLAVGGAANAAGPAPGITQGGGGVTVPGQQLRFVALAGPGLTTLVSTQRATGTVSRSRTIGGDWGVPAVAFDGTTGGLSRDGRHLVIADWVPPESSVLRARSDFQLVDTATLKTIGQISLRGDFA